MHEQLHIYTHVHVHTHTHTSPYTHTQARTHTHKPVHTHTDAYIQTCLYIYTITIKNFKKKPSKNSPNINGFPHSLDVFNMSGFTVAMLLFL